MIIGITGGTGCGKTTLLAVIESFGGTVIDCDAIYHQLLSQDTHLLSQIQDRFPGTVSHGILDRKKLGSIVFQDPQALLDLNVITHSAVKAVVLSKLSPAPKLAAIDAIGLFESGLDKLCDITVAVTAPKQARIARLMAREGITKEYALQRIEAQKPNAYFSSLCGYTLDNDGTQEDFLAKCLAFFTQADIIKEKQ